MNRFEFAGFSINYQVNGVGLPLLLLHGFGEDSGVWQYQIPELEQYCMVIRPDWPGSGKSALGVDSLSEGQKASLCQIDFYADIAKALLDHLGIEKVVVLGHSMGGYITLAFADKFPQCLKGFGLVHSTAYTDTPERKDKRTKAIALMGEFGGYAFLKTSIPNLFAAPFRQEEQARVAVLVEAAQQFDTQVLQWYYTAIKERPDRTKVLKDSTVPVLMIAGEEDTVVPLQDLLQQSHMPNICHLLVLPQTAHMGMWESTEKVNQFVEAFIDSILSFG